MKKISILFFSVFFSSFILYSQKITLYGKAEPGAVMIGKGEKIMSVYLDKRKLLIDENGMFVFGFDRNAKGIHTLKIKFKNGKTETKKINLPKRKYVIQRLKVEKKYVEPPKEELERIRNEADEMKNARANAGKIDSAFYSVGFALPINQMRITCEFGSQRILNGVRKSPHNGIDVGADEGTPVYAISGGVVLIAGENFYYNGNFALIDHGQGLTSVYLHLRKLSVKTGDMVTKGQMIGEVGTTGRSTAPHLHLGMQWYNKRIDPTSVLEMKFP